MNRLKDISKKYTAITDKDSTHSYIDIYEKLFENKIDSCLNLLEIGIFSGGSILMWQDFFINANIFCIDINSNNKIIDEPKIIQIVDDAYSQHIISKLKKINQDKYDIIIDDGPHTLESMVFFVKYYIDLVKDGGMLIIEDIQNILWIDEIKRHIPAKLLHSTEVYDLRNVKNRYDDILMCISK